MAGNTAQAQAPEFCPHGDDCPCHSRAVVQPVPPIHTPMVPDPADLLHLLLLSRRASALFLVRSFSLSVSLSLSPPPPPPPLSPSSPANQMPPTYNALSGLGGSGQVNPTVAANATVALLPPLLRRRRPSSAPSSTSSARAGACSSAGGRIRCTRGPCWPLTVSLPPHLLHGQRADIHAQTPRMAPL